jgi:hypothetical protein
MDNLSDRIRKAFQGVDTRPTQMPKVNPEINPDVMKGIEEYHDNKERTENRRFWIATWLSIIALIVAAISLFLQVRSK